MPPLTTPMTWTMPQGRVAAADFCYKRASSAGPASSSLHSLIRRRRPHGLTQMPSLIRLILALGLLGGLAYGAMFTLVKLVDLKPREISVTVPNDRFAKPR